ncbi:MAG: hypothetical protein QHC90_23160 [Shinella sp.]|nr:hypothetical protein [Shinella sp.]
MEEYDIYRMIDERLESALPKAAPKQMMRIAPFEAFNYQGDEVKVIGVTLQDEDDMDFVVIRTNSEGEMFAGLEDSLWKNPA